MEDLKELIGKTISDIKRKKYPKYDDEPIILIEFTDGTEVYFEAQYGSYTGKSLDEYQTYIEFTDIHSDKDKLIDVEL